MQLNYKLFHALEDTATLMQIRQRTCYSQILEAASN